LGNSAITTVLFKFHPPDQSPFPSVKSLYATVVQLDGSRYPVRRTPKRGLRQVDFVFDGNEIRGLEQNPDTKSERAKAARSLNCGDVTSPSESLTANWNRAGLETMVPVQ
jgi:hypothetical protein